MRAEKTRYPAVAGQFYDDDPDNLRKEIVSYLKEAKQKSGSVAKLGKPLAIIVPHAGYLYSGKTAAVAFANLVGENYKRAILIAPSHRYRVEGLAYGDFDFFQTPLGAINVDKVSLRKIANSSVWVRSAEKAHDGEHSLEVELPFLQVVQAGLPIVPFICGQVNDKIADDLSSVLVDFFNDENIWIISSDFTHYGYSFGYTPFSGGNIAEKIKKLDLGAIDSICACDYNAFRDYVDRTGATICGENPIKILLRTAQNAVKRNMKIAINLSTYANSGEISGDYSHSVSYASILFFKL